jgi:hypothetical protein
MITSKNNQISSFYQRLRIKRVNPEIEGEKGNSAEQGQDCQHQTMKEVL